ncbi:hypothetical protein [Halovulum sp. GXIMD14793]
MSRLSQNIAQNIASKRHEPVAGVRAFWYLNSAADGVGVVRIATMKAATHAADGIGIIREKAMAAWPGVKARLAEKSSAMAEAARKNAEAARVERERQAADAEVEEKVVLPLAVRRRWTKALRDIGKAEVRYYLEEGAHHPSTAPFVHARADTGIMHGATRYPTRAFAYEWLGDDVEKDDGGHWRGLAIAAISAMVVAGLLLWSIS